MALSWAAECFAFLASGRDRAPEKREVIGSRAGDTALLDAAVRCRDRGATTGQGSTGPLNVRSMGHVNDQFEQLQKIIVRGSLRGKMVLASACLSLSQLV
jgi:hypothetical protein